MEIEILPAVLPKSFKDLKEHVGRLRGAVRRVQVDVVDGHFAHAPGFVGKTWPYRDHGTFAEIVKQEHGLPLWEEVDYEFDLMVKEPAPVVMDYVHAGASHIVLHAGSDGAVEALTKLVDLRDEGGTFTVQVGVALGAHAQPAELEPFESQFDFVQVMGIEHEGRQGEPFDHKALFLVERLRALYPELPIQVDGGVKTENIRALVRAGATRLVAGSAIFGAKDAKEAYRALYTEANAQ